jgi:Xaa-Pro aminopeptidase
VANKLIELINQVGEGNLDRRKFLAGIGGTAAAASLLPMLAGKPAMAQIGGPPNYTMAERDRRWKIVRAWMSEQGYDCLVLPHGAGDAHLQHAGYVSNGGFYMAPGAIVFPLEGEPALISSNKPPRPRPGDWISDYTNKWDETGQRSIGEHIIDKVNEKGYAKGNIGVIGTQANVEGLNEFANEGLVNYAVWAMVLAGLPDATFTDVTADFAELILIKGEEEIANYEKAALVGEELHQMMLETTKIGLNDRRFKANVAEFFALKGARPDVQALELAPGDIHDGQLINSEYGIMYAGGYCQVTLCMAVGTVSKQTEELADVAHASLAHGMENLKPGVRFGDVIDGMEKIVSDAGCWHGFPQLHGLRPMFMVGPVYNYPPPFIPSRTLGADVIMKENMIMSFEPGARKGAGPEGGQVKVGGTCLITRDGPRMFNTIGQRMQRV